ncbi:MULTISPECIES: YveK family protein [Bacillus]|uniref:YveK family protein n=1 Tax=Bacillus TaxID=1386 RepID=UPI000361BEFD|nr:MULTISPECIES: Wzz/FepE/Etk N-terminal domain-containing protein [Bacillus]
MEEAFSIKEIVLTLWKRWKLIFGIVFLSGIICAIVTYFYLSPVYQSSTQLLVNQSQNGEDGFNYNEVQTNLQLINTYNVIIKSPAILQLVKEKLNLDYSTENLSQRISVSNQAQSQVVNITVEDQDPVLAVNIANTTSEIFQKEIINIMNIDNVKILSKAKISENPVAVKPKPLMNFAIALGIGLLISVGLSFILEYFDNTVKGAEDIESLLQIPVLGVITLIEDTKDKSPKHKKSKRAYQRGENIGI